MQSLKQVANLSCFYSHWLHQITEATEQTAAEMKSKAAKFSKGISDSCQMCVVVLMSHGISGAIEGIDSKYFKEDDLFDMFTDENCPRLKGIPKLFVFVQCR